MAILGLLVASFVPKGGKGVSLLGILPNNPSNVYASPGGSVSDSYADSSKIDTGNSSYYQVIGGQAKMDLK